MSTVNKWLNDDIFKFTPQLKFSYYSYFWYILINTTLFLDIYEKCTSETFGIFCANFIKELRVRNPQSNQNNKEMYVV